MSAIRYLEVNWFHFQCLGLTFELYVMQVKYHQCYSMQNLKRSPDNIKCNCHLMNCSIIVRDASKTDVFTSYCRHGTIVMVHIISQIDLSLNVDVFSATIKSSCITWKLIVLSNAVALCSHPKTNQYFHSGFQFLTISNGFNQQINLQDFSWKILGCDIPMRFI